MCCSISNELDSNTLKCIHNNSPRTWNDDIAYLAHKKDRKVQNTESLPGNKMATNSTKVHGKFVRNENGPMEGKAVEKVPGIGKAIGPKLREHGITMAKQLYDKYKSTTEEKFKEFIKAHGGTSENQEDAWRGMKEWEEKDRASKKLNEDFKELRI